MNWTAEAGGRRVGCSSAEVERSEWVEEGEEVVLDDSLSAKILKVVWSVWICGGRRTSSVSAWASRRRSTGGWIRVETSKTKNTSAKAGEKPIQEGGQGRKVKLKLKHDKKRIR
jgi:hypothetical protein